MKKTYKIVGKTNGWIARRDSLFKGKTEIVLREGLTLKEAQKELLSMFNEDAEEYNANWGLAVNNRHPHNESLSASPTHQDGTRSYENDSRYFSIEEEEPMEYYNTLERLRDYINEHVADWEIKANDIIAQNGWFDETGYAYGVCHDGKRRLFFNDEYIADIRDLDDEQE